MFVFFLSFLKGSNKTASARQIVKGDTKHSVAWLKLDWMRKMSVSQDSVAVVPLRRNLTKEEGKSFVFWSELGVEEVP